MPWVKPSSALAVGALAALALATAAPAGAQARPQILINQIDDVPLGTWFGIGDMSQIMRFCVGTHGNGRRFRLTATGSASGGAFRINNGASQLPFSLEINDGAGWQSLASGNSLGPLQGTNINKCQDRTEEPLQLRVTLRQSDLATASSGLYSGTVSLMVVPE